MDSELTELSFLRSQCALSPIIGTAPQFREDLATKDELYRVSCIGKAKVAADHSQCQAEAREERRHLGTRRGTNVRAIVSWCPKGSDEGLFVVLPREFVLLDALSCLWPANGSPSTARFSEGRLGPILLTSAQGADDPKRPAGLDGTLPRAASDFGVDLFEQLARPAQQWPPRRCLAVCVAQGREHVILPDYLCRRERHQLAERRGAGSHQASPRVSVANLADERRLGEAVTRATRRPSASRSQTPRRRLRCEHQCLSTEQSTPCLAWTRSRPRGLVRQCQVRDAGLCLQRTKIYSACCGVFRGPRAVRTERGLVGCSLALTGSKNLETSRGRGE